ncbi:ABC transporter permease [Blautia schinkii]|nr:ABC transporter permease [Blautia schinkii]
MGKTVKNALQKFHISYNRLISILILIILMAVASIVNPAFLTADNLLGILAQNSAKGILALGATFVLMTGGIDLACGNGLTMIAVVASVVHITTGENFLVLLLMCLLLGVVLGGINGFLITRMKLLPFVATLAMMSIAKGVTLFASEGKIMFLNHPATIFIGSGRVLGFLPMPVVIFALMCVIAATLLYRTKMGIAVYALGGNKEAAEYSGINVKKEETKVYVFDGICISVAALVTVCRVGQISPNLGEGAMMDAIAAAVIGGTSTMGGKGTIGGTIIGVLIIGVIINALTFLNVPVIAQDAVKGLIIIFAVIFDALINRAKKE